MSDQAIFKADFHADVRRRSVLFTQEKMSLIHDSSLVKQAMVKTRFNYAHHKYTVRNKQSKEEPRYCSPNDWERADLISNVTYRWDGSSLRRHCIQFLSLDLDVEGSDKDLIVNGMLDRTLTRIRIEKRLPEFLPFIDALFPTNSGLSLQICILPIILTHFKADAMLWWVNWLLTCLANVLRSIGIGADLNHCSAINSAPNILKRPLSEVESFLDKRDEIVLRQTHVLSELELMLAPFEGIWTRRKTTRLDEFLYPNIDVEITLLSAYQRALEIDASGFVKQMTYNQLRTFLGSSDHVFRRIRRGYELGWLKTEYLGPFGGYLVTFTPTERLTKRYKKLKSGERDSKKGNLKNIPDALSLMENERNYFAWSCILGLKRAGISEKDSLSILLNLRNVIPNGQSSKTFALSKLSSMLRYFYSSSVTSPVAITDLPQFLQIEIKALE